MTQPVLVVDDHDDSRELLASVLELRGFAIHTAEDGRTALEVAAAVQPVAAVIDIGLPDMDGYELAKRLRALPGLATIHLVALSGYGGAADKARSKEAGIDHHMVKPADLAELARVLAPGRL